MYAALTVLSSTVDVIVLFNDKAMAYSLCALNYDVVLILWNRVFCIAR